MMTETARWNIRIENRGSPITVIAFSGLAPTNQIFEWTKTFKGLAVNLIGVRDPYDCWYQRIAAGLPDCLAPAINGLHTKRLVCIGGSAGGFAALLFGRILDADAVIAFCPQTICGEGKRALGDDRFPQFCANTPTTEWSDIAGDHPRAVVHYALDEPLDAMHVGRITAAEVVEHQAGGHGFVKDLRHSGKLQSIIAKAVS